MKKEKEKEETLDKEEEVKTEVKEEQAEEEEEQVKEESEEKLSLGKKVLLVIRHIVVLAIFALVAYASVHWLKESQIIKKYDFTKQRVNAIEITIFTLLFAIYTCLSSKGKFDNYHRVKILFPVAAAFLTGFFSRDFIYTTALVAEIFLLNFTTVIIARKLPKIANFLNSLFSFLIMLQMGVKIYGGTYISIIMLTNLDSLRDIGGNAVKYILSLIVVIIVSLLPLKKSTKSIKVELLLLIEAIISTVFLTINIRYPFYSIYNYKVVYQDCQKYINEIHEYKNMEVDSHEFYKEEVKDFVSKPDSLPEKPNIIYVFTEGFSDYVIDYEKNLLPNIRDLESKGISFEHYYNHTFATYRGIIGQLYSGYQYHNYDANPLISMQSILSNNGYTSAFINVEPDNREFTRYLKAIGFDKYYDEMENKKSVEGFLKGHLSDKKAYEELYNKAIELNNEGKPFVLGMYTLGTHVSFDGIYHKDYDNAVYNKFNDLDYAVKEFLDKFENGPLFDNTIFIFTTDHGSYADVDYTVAFPDAVRPVSVIDKIPFIIYHKGIEHQEIEVGGRNTLDFAPTVLDYVDVSAPNYFLGESLFSGEDGGTKSDRAYFDGSTIILTDKTGIKHVCKSGEEYDIGKRYIALYLTTNEAKEKENEEIILIDNSIRKVDNSIRKVYTENLIQNLIVE